ncbi:hypothetical protein SLA2020_381270 [Shorea laevis]
MSDPFPADHGLTTRSPMASGGFRIAAHVRLRCAFPLDTGHVLAVGSMVPKVTSVRQFRLNSSLYVSGPTVQVGPGLCALSFCVGRCRGEKGMRRGGEQQQHNYIILAFPSMR